MVPIQRACSKAGLMTQGENVHCAAVQPGIQMSEGVKGEGVAPGATPVQQ